MANLKIDLSNSPLARMSPVTTKATLLPLYNNVGSGVAGYGGPDQWVPVDHSVWNSGYSNTAAWLDAISRYGISGRKSPGEFTPKAYIPLDIFRSLSINAPMEYTKSNKGGIMDGLAPVLSLASLALPALAPVAAAANSVTALGNGNVLGAVGSAFGIPGVGAGITNYLGSSLNNGLASSGIGALSKSATNAVVNGGLSAGMTALGGGSLSDSLKAGLLTGAGSYAGSKITPATTGLSSDSSKALGSAASTLIRSGGNLESAAVSGLGSYGSSLASPYLKSAQNSISSLFSGTPTQSNGNALADTANLSYQPFTEPSASQFMNASADSGSTSKMSIFDDMLGNVGGTYSPIGAVSYLDDTGSAAASDPWQIGQNWYNNLVSDGGALTDYFPSASGSSSSSSNWLTGALNALTSGGTGTKLLAAGLGGLLGGTNGSSKTGTQTTTTAPWAAQQPYLLDLFNKASQAQRASQGTNALQTGAIANASKLANSGNALTSAATKTIGSAINGTLKNPYAGMDNPYLKSAIDNANADVTRAFMPAMNQANAASGSFGNSGVADTYSKNMADAYSKNATGMRMTDYTNQQNLAQQGIQNQLNASFNSTGFNSNNLANAQNQFNFGTQAQHYPLTSLKAYQDLIGGGGYGSTSSSPIYTNSLANALGGAVAGSSIYKNLFGATSGG